MAIDVNSDMMMQKLLLMIHFLSLLRDDRTLLNKLSVFLSSA